MEDFQILRIFEKIIFEIFFFDFFFEFSFLFKLPNLLSYYATNNCALFCRKKWLNSKLGTSEGQWWPRWRKSVGSWSYGFRKWKSDLLCRMACFVSSMQRFHLAATPRIWSRSGKTKLEKVNKNNFCELSIESENQKEKQTKLSSKSQNAHQSFEKTTLRKKVETTKMKCLTSI